MTYDQVCEGSYKIAPTAQNRVSGTGTAMSSDTCPLCGCLVSLDSFGNFLLHPRPTPLPSALKLAREALAEIAHVALAQRGWTPDFPGRRLLLTVGRKASEALAALSRLSTSGAREGE
jgi:hypothetical protein